MGNIKEFLEYILNAVKIWIIIQPWQNGIIVRCGKKVREVKGGVYFKLPYFDSVYVKDGKLRVVSLPIQTLTTKDGKTITISSSAGYCIDSVRKLYETLYHPETTVANIIMSELAEIVFKNNITEISPKFLEETILSKIHFEEYGLKFDYYKISNFAVVRTFRLIQDSSWMYENSATGDSSKII